VRGLERVRPERRDLDRGPAPARAERKTFRDRVRRDGLRWLTHALCLGPFLLLLWDGSRNALTVNPIEEITLRTGKTALVLLVLTLASTPLNRVLGWRWTVPLRRPLGLWTFFYASLHLFTFAVIDYALDPGLIWQAIDEKRYVLAGFSAFLLLVPLAVTSTRGWMRRLGRRWTALHRLIYLAAPVAVLHFVWLVKADRREPLLYGAAVGLLLLLRTPPGRRLTGRFRGQLRGRATVAGAGGAARDVLPASGGAPGGTPSAPRAQGDRGDRQGDPAPVLPSVR
jgi:sulfoxide reductase heme-binding subunit YedZ